MAVCRNHKNIMNLNQSHSIISEVVLRREGLVYKRSNYRQEVQLQFREDSQLFLQTLSIQDNARFRPLLRDYPVKTLTANRIVFQRMANRPACHPLDFIKQVQLVLDGFGVLVVCQSYACEKSLASLRERILALEEETGVSGEVVNAEKGTRCLFVYYYRECERGIMEKVKEYQSARKERLTFSLNKFIRKEVQTHNIKQLILKIHELFSPQLLALCQSRQNARKQVNLTVTGVNPTLVGPEDHDENWLKAQRRGIYGLQFDVYGQEHQFLRFYSLVQSFFSTLTYTVKRSSQISHYHKDVPSLLQKSNLKAAILSQIIVIFRPPENLQSIIKQLNRKKWTLVAKDFLNLDFHLFSQYKRSYLLKIRAQNGSEIRVDSDIIEFQADEHCFKRIKALSRQFLLEMKGEEKTVHFLLCAQDVEIIKKYYMVNSSYQLDWIHGRAILVCPKRQIDDNYNHIQQLYRISRKKLFRVVSRVPIRHSLVKCTQKMVQFSYFPSRRYKAQDLCLTLKPISEIYQQKCILFIINSQDENTELLSILKRNYETVKKYVQYDMQEVVTQNQLKLQSIYIIKMGGKDIPTVKPDKIRKILEAFIMRKAPVRVVLPSPSLRIYQHLLKMIVEHVAYRRSALQNKEISIFLPPLEHAIDSSDKILQSISETVQNVGSFKLVNLYFLSGRQILQGSTLGLVRMRCRIKQKEVRCTSLNSFIFKCELESKRSTKFRIGLFLPKKQCREYLVCLTTGQIYVLGKYQVVRTETNSQNFKSIIELLKKQFQRQNYAVLYFDPENHCYLSSLYVYDSEAEGIFRRCKMDLPSLRILQGAETIQFHVKCEREGGFLLQTHGEFKQELLGLLWRQGVRD